MDASKMSKKAIAKIIGIPSTKSSLIPTEGNLILVSGETYIKYAKKYKIPLSKGGVKREFKDLKLLIREYEKDHKIKGGLYY